MIDAIGAVSDALEAPDLNTGEINVALLMQSANNVPDETGIPQPGPKGRAYIRHQSCFLHVISLD